MSEFIFSIEPLFSKRMDIAKQAADWCKEKKIPPVAFNIITAAIHLKLLALPDVSTKLRDELKK